MRGIYRRLRTHQRGGVGDVEVEPDVVGVVEPDIFFFVVVLDDVPDCVFVPVPEVSEDDEPEEPEVPFVVVEPGPLYGPVFVVVPVVPVVPPVP